MSGIDSSSKNKNTQNQLYSYYRRILYIIVSHIKSLILTTKEYVVTLTNVGNKQQAIRNRFDSFTTTKQQIKRITMRFLSKFSTFTAVPIVVLALLSLFLLTTTTSSSGQVSAVTAQERGLDVCPKTSKQLYVFIGPHRSASTSVEDFFYKYARGRQPGGSHGKTYHALKNIRWPLVYGEYTNDTYVEEPYRRYNSIISDSTNLNIRTEIFDSIKRDWELPNDVNSILFGGEEYDQLKPFLKSNGENIGGANNGGGYDSMNAISDIVNHLGIPSKDCVTIIVNYRLSRFEHWMSIYNDFNARRSSSSGGDKEDVEDETIRSYEDHMCSETSSDKKNRIRELGTTMNPMYLSTKFLEQGYNVKMIDMSGISDHGTDISHTIGCNILGGKCEESGWVKGHVDETITNHVFDIKKGQGAIERKLIDNAEKIFLYRDCAYEKDLESNPKFDIVMRNTIWNACSNDVDDNTITNNISAHTMRNVYQSLKTGTKGITRYDDTMDYTNIANNGNIADIFGTVEDGNQLLFDALLSQVNCNSGTEKKKNGNEIQVSIENVLNGQYIQDVNANPRYNNRNKSSKKKKHHGFVWFLLIMGGVVLGFYIKKHGLNGTINDGRRYANHGRNYVTEMTNDGRNYVTEMTGHDLGGSSGGYKDNNQKRSSTGFSDGIGGGFSDGPKLNVIPSDPYCDKEDEDQVDII